MCVAGEGERWMYQKAPVTTFGTVKRACLICMNTRDWSKGTIRNSLLQLLNERWVKVTCFCAINDRKLVDFDTLIVVFLKFI
jgi:hypothetical protein